MNWGETWDVQNTKDCFKQNYECKQHMEKDKQSRGIAVKMHFLWTDTGWVLID